MRKLLLVVIAVLLACASAALASVGSTSVGASVDSNSPGQSEAYKYVASASETVNRMSVYLDAANTASKVDIGLYNNASPHALLSHCVVSPTVKSAWNRCKLPSTVSIVSGATYWTALLQPAGTSGTLKFRYANVTGGAAVTSTQTNLTALSSAFSAGANWGSQRASLYADFASVPTPTPTPTPSPTPTPTPTPPPSGTCFTSPGSCGFPDPAYGNVGVPAGTALTSSGSITVNTAGTVIDGKDVKGSIDVNANNVTIKNTRITGTYSCPGLLACGNSLIHLTGPYNVTVSHVELTTPTGVGVEHAIRNTYDGTLHIDHAYQHGDVDSLCHCGNATITDSYSNIHDALYGDPSTDADDDHLENMYVDNKTLDVERNTLINREGQTANVFMDNGNNHLTAKGNLLAGGGFSFDLCKSAGCSTSSAVITGNTFTRCDHGREVMGGGGTWVCAHGADAYGLFPRSGDYGRTNGYPTTATWSGNVWDDDGSTASP